MQTKISALISRVNPAALVPKAVSDSGKVSAHAREEEGALPLAEGQFRRMLCQERKRSERSRKHFVLMLVRAGSLTGQNGAAYFPNRVTTVIRQAIRDTDTLGWFQGNAVLGVIFSELGDVEVSAAANAIKTKVSIALKAVLHENLLGKLELDFYVFPEHRRSEGYKLPIDPELYPDVFELDERKKLSLLIKRVVDLVGSSCALVVLSPVFLVLAIVIKLTSDGPIFFRQERLGQFEVPFTFLKFRSMGISTSPEIHREYVKSFINGTADPHVPGGNARKVYKITNDPRVTWIGRFMRRTSLDELPQFWNVLKGDMALVGPRPPIRYELEVYDLWHRRRLLEVKPGITGLWQIHGRSRTTFDEMVRLDLRYAKTWSPLTDLKILLQTPRAVFSGNGAY